MTFFEEVQSYVEVFICLTSIAITASSLLMRFFATQGPILPIQALQIADALWLENDFSRLDYPSIPNSSAIASNVP